MAKLADIMCPLHGHCYRQNVFRLDIATGIAIHAEHCPGRIVAEKTEPSTHCPGRDASVGAQAGMLWGYDPSLQSNPITQVGETKTDYRYRLLRTQEYIIADITPSL